MNSLKLNHSLDNFSVLPLKSKSESREHDHNILKHSVNVAVKVKHDLVSTHMMEITEFENNLGESCKYSYT